MLHVKTLALAIHTCAFVQVHTLETIVKHVIKRELDFNFFFFDSSFNLFCNLVTSVCANNPCLNGGTCVISGSSYVCSCAALYTGTTCQISKFIFRFSVLNIYIKKNFILKQ